MSKPVPIINPSLLSLLDDFVPTTSVKASPKNLTTISVKVDKNDLKQKLTAIKTDLYRLKGEIQAETFKLTDFITKNDYMFSKFLEVQEISKKVDIDLTEDFDALRKELQ